MRKQHAQAMAAALIIGYWCAAEADPAATASVGTPDIARVEIDAAKWNLIISGTNFGPNMTAVRFGGQGLSVISASSNRIVAALPPVLPAASYRLTLANPQDASKSDSFDVPVFNLYRNTPRGH